MQRWRPAAASLFGSRFWLTSYIALALGFWVPEAWVSDEPMAALVPIFLGGILFFSGLRLPLVELGTMLRPGILLWRALLVLPVKLLLIPLIAYALALLLIPQWAPGVLLVALMPMGLSTIAFTDLYAGLRMLALLLVVLTSLCAPLSVPLMLVLLGHAGEGGFPLWPVLERTLYILLLLGIPLTLAQLVRQRFPTMVTKYHQTWNGWAIASSCALIFASVVGTRPWWQDMEMVDLGWALVAATLASVLSFILSLALVWRWPRESAVAVVIGSVFMNNGLAVAFALRFFPGQPEVLLPCLLMQFPMVAATALAGHWLKPLPAPRSL